MNERTMIRSLMVGLLSLSTSLALMAQVVLQGRVIDEGKHGLPAASVKLLGSGGKLQTGTTTSANGSYRLGNVPKGTYTLEVSFIGYTTVKQSVKVSESSGEQKLATITLKEDAQALKEVSVVGKATEVTVKGDTIEYNAASFTQMDAAVLEDLVKKLPGAEIDASGKITINGKSISQIMVDGKRFFESDPKIALKNLPADLVDKVQVFDKDSENARMTGFSDGDEETVINLSLKAGKKQGLFGTAMVGAGTKSRYDASGILNRFSGNEQFSILAATNNINNAGFSDISSDLSSSGLGMQAGGGGRGPGGGGSFGLGGDGITISRMLGGNYINAKGKQSEFGINAYYGGSNKTVERKSDATNLLGSGSTTESGTTSETNNKDNVGLNLRWQWTPSKSTELIVTPQLTYGYGKGEYYGASNTINDLTGSQITSSSLRQGTDSKNFNGQLRADFSQKLNSRGRTLAISLEAGYNNDRGEGKYLSQLDNVSTGLRVIDQAIDQKSTGGSYRLRLNYVEPLSQTLSLQVQYQFRGQHSSSNRWAFDADGSGLYTLANSLYSSEFNSDFYSHRAGLAFKKVWGKAELTAGANIDPSSLYSITTRSGVRREVNQHSLNYSPTLRFNYKPSKAFDLRFDYRGRSFQPSASQLSPVEDVTNPLVTYVGNPNLSPGFTHNLMGRLSLFNASSQSALNLFGMAQYVENDIVSQTTYDLSTGVRTTTYTNVSGNARLSLGGFFTTPLFGKVLSLRIGSRNTVTRQIGFVDGSRNTAVAYNLDESLGIGYRNSFLDATVRGGITFYTVNNSLESVSGQTTRDYRLELENIATLPLGFKLEAQANYIVGSGYTSDFGRERTLINLGLTYSFLRGKAATIRLKVYDLLDQNRSINRQITALSSSTTETNTLGRYAMLHFIYKFNSFSGNASASDMRSGQRGFGNGPGGPPPGRF